MQGGSQQPEKLVSGIGLYFTSDEAHGNKVYVKTIMKGGSAEHDGTVRVGDYIQSVEKVMKAPIPPRSVVFGDGTVWGALMMGNGTA